MKIINAHNHLINAKEVLGDSELESYVSQVEVFKDLEAIKKYLLPETLIKQHDEANIYKTVLYALDGPILSASNEFVSKMCKLYPDKFIGFASVNPLKKDSVKELKHAILDLRLKGLKLHPPLQGFAPNDKRAYPVYKLAEELNIPVVFHIGTTPFGSLVRLSDANPLLIDDIAVDFPKLKIMLTHLGTLWTNETIMIVEKNPNVYLDTAAYLYEIKQILTKENIQRIGEDKLIFGTDYPMPYGGKIHRVKDFVDCINSLNISKSIKEKIFYKNFEKMIGEKIK